MFINNLPKASRQATVLLNKNEIKNQGIFRHLLINSIIGLILLVSTQSSTRGAQIYFNDFEIGADANWSNNSIFVTPSGRSTLGRFGNQTVSLSFTNLPAHSAISISFDLFVNGSWDGNGEGCCGPDVWGLGVTGGSTLLNTTFANGGGPGDRNTQAFPGQFPGGQFAPLTGATENPYLGIGTDFVYRLTFIVPHTTGTIQFNFFGAGLQGLTDENWSLDNVSVSAIPEPSTFTLFLAGGGIVSLFLRWSPRKCEVTANLPFEERNQESQTTS